MSLERRASKSGSAKDVQDKLNEKYDIHKAGECMEWMARATDQNFDVDGSPENVHEQLKDGMILLHLYSAIDPSYTFQAEREKNSTDFHRMDRIGRFIDKIKGPPLNIPPHCVFATADLTDEANMAQVITCLETVARKSLVIDSPAGGFGPPESDPHPREFTEEQLASGRSVIGGQMGSNQYATQKGLSMGKTRKIMD